MRIAIYIARFIAIVLGLAFLFTWLGVYDSDALKWQSAFTFWAVTMAIGIGASESLAAVFWRGRYSHWPAVAQVAIVAALAAFPITAALWLFNGGAGSWPTLQVWAINYFYVLIISVVMNTIVFVARRLKTQATALDGADTADSAQARFMERLPVKYRGAALYAVSSEDHYLRVHTDRGEEMILMRLADAVRELAGAGGLQTHRSWWVALDGVSDSRKDGGKLVLELKSGGEAPVSRTFQSAVKEAGLV